MSSELEHYWSGEETIPEIDLNQPWTSQSMLDKVQSLLQNQAPLKRDFVVTGDEAASSNNSFKLMQWNILAQALSTGKDNFVRCPSGALVWEWRRLRILEEILINNPDVLCMQEVDHYAFFNSMLGALGYSGIFFPKPDSPALYTENTNGPDGCAIFYKESSIEILNQETIVLKKSNDGILTNQVSVIITFHLRRDHAENASTKQKITVATTHLKAKSGWDSLRHMQGQYLLDYLSQHYADNAIIVCGDFNAECSEPVYAAYANSPLNFNSAYKQLGDSQEEPLYTTWKFRGKADGEVEVRHTIDYIWYQPRHLALHSVMDIPSEEALGSGKLPSYAFPSDHLSLAAEFHIL